MTIVEWILLIEVVIFAVLGIMLVLMLFNRNRTGRIRQSRGSALSGTNCPAQNSCDLYRMSYPRIDNHPTVYNAARYAQDPQYFENQWNYYGSAAAGPGSYQEARYRGAPGNAAAYYGQGYGNQTIPSPAIGQEQGQILYRKGLSPADISAMEGRTLRHIDGEREGNYGNGTTIPYEAQETLLQKVDSGSGNSVYRTAGSSDAVNGARADSDKKTRWKIDFVEMSSGREVTRDFQNTLVVGRQMPAPLESGRLYLSMDATVSRSQFCLFIEDERLMIENLSRVNVTKKNGNPVWQPVSLEEGDILEMGRMRYMVKEIRRIA